MVSDQISPADFGNNMVEIVENLIVKVGKKEHLLYHPPPPAQNTYAMQHIQDSVTYENAKQNKITGEIINDWKDYTLKYFKLSSSVFMQENKYF